MVGPAKLESCGGSPLRLGARDSPTGKRGLTNGKKKIAQVSGVCHGLSGRRRTIRACRKGKGRWTLPPGAVTPL